MMCSVNQLGLDAGALRGMEHHSGPSH